MKKILLFLAPHAVAIIVFISVAVAYFSPLLDDYQLSQGDVANWKGMSKEIADYRILHGEEPLWTNAMFSGMPAYQISVLHHGNWIKKAEPWLRFNLPHPMAVLFMAMMGFYIFCLCVGVNPWLGIAGSIAFGLSTINILYLGAGHTSKVNAIAYMAPVLGGLILAFRRKVLAGTAVFAIFLALHLSANHLQMSYYLAILLGAVGLTEVIRLMIDRKVIHALKVSAVLLFGALLAVLPNWSNLITTYEYGQYTTRGKSELTISKDGEAKSESEIAGLEKGYILEYNFGKGEAWQLLIPNVKGGKSGYIGEDKEVMRKIKAAPQVKERVAEMNHYWGGQAGTGGAFYFGAFMIFFFVLALIFSKDWIKWPFLLVGLLALALCSNDPSGINGFFIDSFPGYSKFRDSKMILVLLMIMIPALSIIFINSLLVRKEEFVARYKKIMSIAAGVLVTIMLVILLTPDKFFTFVSADEAVQFDEALAGVDSEQRGGLLELLDTLEAVRIEIFKEDAQRSLLFFVLAAGVFLAFIFLKKGKEVLIVIIAITVFGDLWSVDQRYLNSKKEKSQYKNYIASEQKAFPFMPSQADISILQREAAGMESRVDSLSLILESGMKQQPEFAKLKKKGNIEWASDFGALNMLSNYRVMSINNPFANASTSYFHKSIGGYHGAKLKKYQELWDYSLKNEYQMLYDSLKAGTYVNALATADVLNMLNTKYIIVNESMAALENTAAFGSAWFASELRIVNSADDALKALSTEDLKKVAVVRNQFADLLPPQISADSTAQIECTLYDVNRITYSSSSVSEGVVVFSEIYYPAGWKCVIDGTDTPYAEANYVLRAVKVPAGNHQIEWIFDPPSFKSATSISTAGSALLIVLVLGSVYYEFRKKRIIEKA